MRQAAIISEQAAPEPVPAALLATIRSLRALSDELHLTLRDVILLAAASPHIVLQDVADAAGISISTLHRMRAEMSDG